VCGKHDVGLLFGNSREHQLDICGEVAGTPALLTLDRIRGKFRCPLFYFHNIGLDRRFYRPNLDRHDTLVLPRSLHCHFVDTGQTGGYLLRTGDEFPNISLGRGNTKTFFNIHWASLYQVKGHYIAGV